MAYRDERYFERDRGSDDAFRDRDRFGDRGDPRREWLPGPAMPGVLGVPGLLPFGAPPFTGMLGYGAAGTYGYGALGADRSLGRYSGRGPRRYRRSDERVHDDVHERLTLHPDIDASEVDVEVRDGTVIVRGIVPDRGQKHLIEDVIENVLGVLDIDNALKVRHGFLATLTGEKASDEEIARADARERSDDARRGRTRSARTRTDAGAV
jgi:hypothetical protein